MIVGVKADLRHEFRDFADGAPDILELLGELSLCRDLLGESPPSLSNGESCRCEDSLVQYESALLALALSLGHCLSRRESGRSS